MQNGAEIVGLAPEIFRDMQRIVRPGDEVLGVGGNGAGAENVCGVLKSRRYALVSRGLIHFIELGDDALPALIVRLTLSGLRRFALGPLRRFAFRLLLLLKAIDLTATSFSPNGWANSGPRWRKRRYVTNAGTLSTKRPLAREFASQSEAGEALEAWRTKHPELRFSLSRAV